MRRAWIGALALCAAAALLAPASAGADPFGLSDLDVTFTDPQGVRGHPGGLPSLSR